MKPVLRLLDPISLFRGSMMVVGVYAVIRYATEWAYALGKFVGAS